MKTKIYEFSQTNSGGSFVVDENLCHRVFIEAKTTEEAIEKAESLGVYFDGVYENLDCPCCGDRWNSPNIVAFPLYWDETKKFKTVSEYAQHLANEHGWTTPDARIFYLNGTVEDIFQKED